MRLQAAPAFGAGARSSVIERRSNRFDRNARGTSFRLQCDLATNPTIGTTRDHAPRDPSPAARGLRGPVAERQSSGGAGAAGSKSRSELSGARPPESDPAIRLPKPGGYGGLDFGMGGTSSLGETCSPNGREPTKSRQPRTRGCFRSRYRRSAASRPSSEVPDPATEARSSLDSRPPLPLRLVARDPRRTECFFAC